MKRKTNSFTAYDPFARKYIIDVWTDFEDTADSGVGKEVAGVKSFVTSAGENVERIEKGKFALVFPSGATVILTSLPPNAD